MNGLVVGVRRRRPAQPRRAPGSVDRPDADDLLADPPPSWIVEHAIDQLGQRCDARNLAGRLPAPAPRRPNVQRIIGEQLATRSPEPRRLGLSRRVRRQPVRHVRQQRGVRRPSLRRTRAGDGGGVGQHRRVPQPETGVASRGPRTDGATRVAAVAPATLIVERIISVHGISEHSCPATKHAVPEVTATVAA